MIVSDYQQLPPRFQHYRRDELYQIRFPMRARSHLVLVFDLWYVGKIEILLLCWLKDIGALVQVQKKQKTDADSVNS